MIRSHHFHSEWWGAPVGVIDDPAFLSLPADERARQLAGYSWVELRAGMKSVDSLALREAGFMQIDTQIAFRINISQVASGPSMATLDVERASDSPFTIESDEIAPFTHERFRHLPGITAERIDARFVLWARQHLATHPEWCLRVTSGGITQGWFLSAMTKKGLNLELAMLHRGATISGMYLYQKALTTYAAFGARVGFARFSVENTAVMNIYARLGAQFLAPLGIWLWTAETR
jgi:hypothetical protein